MARNDAAGAAISLGIFGVLAYYLWNNYGEEIKKLFGKKNPANLADAANTAIGKDLLKSGTGAGAYVVDGTDWGEKIAKLFTLPAGRLQTMRLPDGSIGELAVMHETNVYGNLGAGRVNPSVRGDGFGTDRVEDYTPGTQFDGTYWGGLPSKTGGVWRWKF
jgi:hypothetical protein